MIFSWVYRLNGRSLTPDCVPTVFTWLEKNPKKAPIEKERAQKWDWICHSLEVCPFSLFKENRFIMEALLISILRVIYICDTSLNGCKGILLFICLVCFLHDCFFESLNWYTFLTNSLVTPRFHLKVLTYFVTPGLKIAYKFIEARKHRNPVCLKENE